MNIKVQLNKNVLKKINSDTFGLFASHEWHRLINPYTPHLTGKLERNVSYKPWQFTYLSPYSLYQYNGVLFVDPIYQVGGFTNDGGISWFSRRGVKKINSGKPLQYNKEHNSKATKEWDKAAIREKKDKNLASAMQGWVNKNI